MTDFNYSVDADGIAIINWNSPEKLMNIMNLDSAADLDALVDKGLADSAVIGIIITSSKASFSAGMDLSAIVKIPGIMTDYPKQYLFDGIMKFNSIMRKIERAGMNSENQGGKPIAAALPGTALGIGYEIALSCHRIFIADNLEARIGFPEVLVGIPPIGGGTTRLSRKLNKSDVADILLEGKLSDLNSALKLGLVDEVVPKAELLSVAKQWIKTAKVSDIIKLWDVNNSNIPDEVLAGNSDFEDYSNSTYEAYNAKGVYPVVNAMIDAIYDNSDIAFDDAIHIEASWFVNTLMNPSRNTAVDTFLVHKAALDKGAARPLNTKDMSVKKLGVMGAGMMGAGIAFVSARAGIEVVLLDRDQAAADKGLATIQSLLDQGIKRKNMTAENATKVIALVMPTARYEDLKGCDLIVEAVFEDPKIKSTVTRAAEVQLDVDAIFATNTSTLPISELAKASRDESRYIGIHFFSPVHLMNLVEIIKGKNTGNEAVAKALDFVCQINKTPIVVNDARFFYANRCILPYVNEGIRMIAEGVDPRLVEDAAKLMGMPVGPLQLTDEISIDLSLKIMKATQAAMGDAYPYSAADDIIEKMFNDDRMGRKNCKGFYAYDDKGKRTEIWEGLGLQWRVATIQPDITEIKYRLAMAQVLEAVRSLEDGVLEDIREGDVGAVLGWGFQPWSGGPFGWLDMIGAEKAVTICKDLEGKFGARFNAPAVLCDLAAFGETFYQRFNVKN